MRLAQAMLFLAFLQGNVITMPQPEIGYVLQNGLVLHLDFCENSD